MKAEEGGVLGVVREGAVLYLPFSGAMGLLEAASGWRYLEWTGRGGCTTAVPACPCRLETKFRALCSDRPGYLLIFVVNCCAFGGPGSCLFLHSEGGLKTGVLRQLLSLESSLLRAPFGEGQRTSGLTKLSLAWLG